MTKTPIQASYNNYVIKAFNSLMYKYFCIGFINFMLKGKSLLHHTNLF